MKILLAVLFFTFGASFGQPCGDRTCDDAAIKAIFDANSLPYNNATGEIANLVSTGRVTVLNLIGPGIKTIPAAIGRLVSLHDLTIQNTNITSLPPQIGLVNIVRNVVIMDNKLLTSLPMEIGNWGANSTKIVKLDRNGLTSLPSTIGNWTELEALSASGNKLTTVPKEIQNFDHGYFQRVDLSNNMIDSLPIEIGGIANLRILLLNNNRLTKFPAGVFNFSQLGTLDLSNNLITSIPPTISSRKALTELNVSNNKITALPTEIAGATLLKKLLLNNNQIANLPSVLWNMTSLIYLELKGNLISTIPTEVSKLTLLQRLILSRNQITDLPPSIANLTSLYGLEVGYNRLCSLPQAVVSWADKYTIDSVAWLSTQTKNGTTGCSGVSISEQNPQVDSYRMNKNLRDHSMTFFHKEGSCEFSLYTTSGNLIISSTSFNNPATFNYGPIPKGIYLLQFNSKSEKRWQKLLLE